MTLEELENTLPWGLHDAYVEHLAIDWVECIATLRVRVMITESQDMDQRAAIELRGLSYCAIEAPDPASGP